MQKIIPGGFCLIFFFLSFFPPLIRLVSRLVGWLVGWLVGCTSFYFTCVYHMHLFSYSPIQLISVTVARHRHHFDRIVVSLTESNDMQVWKGLVTRSVLQSLSGLVLYHPFILLCSKYSLA